jgi:hypothetical protein
LANSRSTGAGQPKRRSMMRAHHTPNTVCRKPVSGH